MATTETCATCTEPHTTRHVSTSRSRMFSVCHMSDSDTLLVCSRENGPDRKYAYWLVALSRNGSEWREAQRVQTDGKREIRCALTDSRVLIGVAIYVRTNLELFCVESGPRIARVYRIHVPEQYKWSRRHAAATCSWRFRTRWTSRCACIDCAATGGGTRAHPVAETLLSLVSR